MDILYRTQHHPPGAHAARAAAHSGHHRHDFAGVLIGPHGLHLLNRDSSFELFGKVGLYYIMFLASLEMNMQDIRSMRGQALTLGGLSFAIPMVVGWLTNHLLLGYAMAAAVLMACMYASHTLISYPIVIRYGIARTRSVGLAVGATIVADTLTLLVLAVVGGMFKENVTGWYWLMLAFKVILLGALITFCFPRLCRWFSGATTRAWCNTSLYWGWCSWAPV